VATSLSIMIASRIACQPGHTTMDQGAPAMRLMELPTAQPRWQPAPADCLFLRPPVRASKTANHG
jgi:hypothetical protein